MKPCNISAIFLASYIAAICALTANEKAAFDSAVLLTENGDVYNFFSSGYPPHAIDNSVNPGEATVQNFTYNITITPDNTGNTVWCTSLGPVGFATNGVAIYNALTGDTTDAVVYEVFDDCKGHSSPDGAYHYHQFPVCVGSLNNVDEFIGMALDGNPIYGPNASDQSELLTSADLDACHGRFLNSEYRYHITADFPYVLGCYKAEPAATLIAGGQDGQGPPRGQGPSRKRRQTQEQATCTNTDGAAELCDCTVGVLTSCDTLMGDQACDAGETTTSDAVTRLAITSLTLLAAACLLLQ